MKIRENPRRQFGLKARILIVALPVIIALVANAQNTIVASVPTDEEDEFSRCEQTQKDVQICKQKNEDNDRCSQLKAESARCDKINSLVNLKYNEIKKNGFYTRRICGLKVNSRGLDDSLPVFRTNPFGQSLTPWLERKESAERCRMVNKDSRMIDRIFASIEGLRADVTPEQRQMLEALVFAQGKLDEKRQNQVAMMKFLRSCLSPKKEKPKGLKEACDGVGQDFINNLQDRLTVARGLLQRAQQTPKIEAPEPRVSGLITKTLDRPTEMQAFSIEELARVKEIIKQDSPANKELKWLWEQGDSSDKSLAAYFFLLGKTPILTSFSGANLDRAGLDAALKKRIDRITESSNQPQGLSERLVTSVAEVDQALLAAKEKMIKKQITEDDFYKLCVNMDVQLLRVLDTQEYLRRDLIIASAVVALTITEPQVGARIGIKVIPAYLAQVSRSMALTGMGAGVLGTAAVYQRVQEIDKACSDMFADKDIRTQAGTFCRLDSANHNIEKAQFDIVASAVIGAGVMLAPKAIALIKALRTKPESEAEAIAAGLTDIATEAGTAAKTSK